jgi:hypothetical protein
VNPLMIASIFAAAMASLAIIAVQYRVRSRKRIEAPRRPELARAIRQEDGHVVIPSGGARAGKAGDGRKPVEATQTKQQQAVALEHQVDDTIRRLILMN